MTGNRELRFDSLVKVIRNNRIWCLCLLFLFLQIVILAWHCDDAYHGYRMSWNLINGNGFVYNPGERVSATTAPLYTLIITIPYFLTGSMFYSALLCNTVFSMTAIFVMQKTFARGNGALLLSACMLCFCSSFISFTTSGLENSLLYLLAGLIAIMFTRWEEFGTKQLLLLSFVSSLLINTRMDCALIIFPLLVYAFLIKSHNKFLAIGCGILGMLPFIAWEIFSIIYYGFPFPNTMYMKLGTGIPLSYYLDHGIKYFTVTLWSDPLVIVVPAVYIIGAFLKRKAKHMAIALGILLYWIYVFYIGGDYMMGRHNTVMFFVSVFCALDLFGLSALPLALEKPAYMTAKPIGLVLAACLVFTCLNTNSPMYMLWGSHLQKMGRGSYNEFTAVEDERDYYYVWTSIIGRYQRARIAGIPVSGSDLNWLVSQEFFDMEEAGLTRDILADAWGATMFHHAGHRYINDQYGLGDPLRARLPAIWDETTSDLLKVGHMVRALPEGYRESIRSWANEIRDPSLAEYYDILCVITRSEDLFAPRRLKMILDMNLGRYDYLIDEYVARQAEKTEEVIT